MTIPYRTISEKLNEPLRGSQSAAAFKLYCKTKSLKMKDVELLVFIDWMKDGLTKLRAGCSGKNVFISRKKAKQALKKHKVRHENDGVYECAHCQRWHITSNLLEPQGEVFRYFLYGVELI